MSICKKCEKRNICKEICPELHKKISARGISPRRKDKTYTVDFSLLESNQSLNAFQLEIRRKTVRDTFLKEIAGIDLQELIQKYLSGREEEAVHLLLEGYCQQEIASRMKVSQKRVNVLIKKAIRKMKIFFNEGV